MDTPFERIDREVRREWLENPTTIAYLKTLLEHRQGLVDNLIDAAKGGQIDFDRMGRVGGEIRAVDFFTMLATKE
jgi:hypothetical protein